VDDHVRRRSSVRVTMLWPLFERFVAWAGLQGHEVTVLPGPNAYIVVPGSPPDRHGYGI
jgi:hypothetical protein